VRRRETHLGSMHVWMLGEFIRSKCEPINTSLSAHNHHSIIASSFVRVPDLHWGPLQAEVSFECG